MATIHFSQPFISAAFISAANVTAIVGTAAASPSSINPAHLGHVTAGQVILNIYGGAVPASFAALPDYSTRASDLLLSFTSLSHNALSTGTAPGLKVILGIQGTPTAAIASGTATWFLLIHAGSSVGTLTTDRGAMMGTVGLTGSGADLEIGDVQVENGVKYTSTGVYFNFPSGWTV